MWLLARPLKGQGALLQGLLLCLEENVLYKSQVSCISISLHTAMVSAAFRHPVNVQTLIRVVHVMVMIWLLRFLLELHLGQSEQTECPGQGEGGEHHTTCLTHPPAPHLYCMVLGSSISGLHQLL